MASDQQTTEFATGAQRSKLEHLDFVGLHPIALIALARTSAEGAEKYGRHNWERGMSVTSLLNHVLRHLYLYLAGDRSEPHLPHAMWGLHAAIVSEALWPHLNTDLRHAGELTPEMVRHLELHAPELRARREAGGLELSDNWRTAEIPEVRSILGLDG